MATKQEDSSGLRPAVAVCLSVLLAFLGLGLLLWALSRAVRPPVLDAAFLDRFACESRFFNPLPFQRVGFQAVCLASPFLILLALLPARALADRLPAAWLASGGERRVWIGLSLLVGLLFAACLVHIAWFPHPPEAYNSPRWLVHSVVKHLSPLELGCVGALGLGLGWFLARAGRPSARSGGIAAGLLLAAWLFTSPVKFFSAADVADTIPFMVHFNAVAHSVVEVANGRHRLVDFTNQYGGYVEFLGPVLRLLPHRVESLALVFCLVHAATLLFLLALARLVLADDRLWLVAGLGLLFCGNLYLFLFGGGDYFFHTYAARLFLPGAALCLAFLYFRSPSPWRYAAVSALAGAATVWNLESGVVLWAAWVAALGHASLCKRRWAGPALHLAAQGAALAAAWGIFWLYLFLASGHWPDGHRLIAYQALFYAGGMGNLPMVVPDVWVPVIAVYLAAMARCGLAWYRGESGPRHSFAVMLIVFGMGLFSYFQNKAASVNLLFVSFPAVLLFAMAVDGRLARRGTPRTLWSWGPLAPGLLVLGWWALNLVIALPVVARGLEREAATLLHPPATPFQTDAAFIAAHAAPGEPCLILSRQSGLHHLVSGTPGVLDLASPEEWETTAEFESVFAALRERRLAKVFLDQDFFKFQWVKPELLEELRQTLGASYRPAAESPGGKVTLYLPAP